MRRWARLWRCGSRGRRFRPYRSDDVFGAEIGGAVKNVLAIACGVVAGRGLGQNAAAALIARGFAEMTPFRSGARCAGGDAGRLVGAGRSGADLFVDQLAQLQSGAGPWPGRVPKRFCSHRRTVAEGAATAPVLAEAARAVGVEMPITEAVRDLLAGTADVAEVVDRLLARPLSAEAR